MNLRSIGREFPAGERSVRVAVHAVDRFRERFPADADGFDRSELSDILESLVEEGRLMTVRQCHDRFKNTVADHADRRVVYSPAVGALLSIQLFEGDWIVWTVYRAVERYPLAIETKGRTR